MQQGTCEWCDTQFDRTTRTRRFCGDACQRKASRVRLRQRLEQAECKRCGSTFQRHVEYGRDANRQVYCSGLCHAQAKGERFGKECVHGITPMCECPTCEAEREARRQARQRDLEAKQTTAVIERIFKADPCAYCGQRDGEGLRAIGIDHIIPDSSGGEDEWTNWTACCRRCNGQKGTLPLLGYLLWRSVYPTKKAVDDEMRLIQALRP